ncbi:hypothetical protein AGOR_G00123940 [Albula goreensis]|uniref:Uncharacterized protein n=1 Tax=Albula goreensis TaxID=1534307 RepID=A0A8T3D7C8_9TELE|nr:hypothetical protein AGOR_G00123940 [Albula goreensis]
MYGQAKLQVGFTDRDLPCQLCGALHRYHPHNHEPLHTDGSKGDPLTRVCVSVAFADGLADGSQCTLYLGLLYVHGSLYSQWKKSLSTTYVTEGKNEWRL